MSAPKYDDGDLLWRVAGLVVAHGLGTEVAIKKALDELRWAEKRRELLQPEEQRELRQAEELHLERIKKKYQVEGPAREVDIRRDQQREAPDRVLFYWCVAPGNLEGLRRPDSAQAIHDAQEAIIRLEEVAQWALQSAAELRRQITQGRERLAPDSKVSGLSSAMLTILGRGGPDRGLIKRAAELHLALHRKFRNRGNRRAPAS